MDCERHRRYRPIGSPSIAVIVWTLGLSIPRIMGANFIHIRGVKWEARGQGESLTEDADGSGSPRYRRQKITPKDLIL